MQHRVAPIIVAVILTTIVVPAAGWTPPVGIPMPDFGIDETHMMYVGATYDFGAGPVPYPDAGNGPYTHYVDNTHPSATDSGNLFGTPATPRDTIPLNLPAGSVVEIHGGPYAYGNYYGNRLGTTGTGTAAKPIFVRGTNANNRAVFAGEVTIRGSYIIVENIKTDTVGNDEGVLRVWNPSDHICVRHCEATNLAPLPEGHGFRAIWAVVVKSVAAGGDPETAFNEDIVFYDNYIHDNGYPPTYETGLQGIIVSGNSKRVWIVDNTIIYNGEDGVQLFYNSANSHYWADRIYIGRNLIHHNGENAIDIKQSTNVIISQNVMHSYIPTNFPSSGSDGTAVVVHYDPVDVWILLNNIYDSANGIRSNGAQRAFIISNLIHNIHHVGGDYNPGSVWASGAAIITWANPQMHVVGNTMYDIDAGFSAPSGGAFEFHILNNIISKLAEPAHHIAIPVSAPANISVMNHNIVHQGGAGARIKWGSSVVRDLAGFRAAYPTQGEGCTEDDPLLVDPDNGDLHVHEASPATDAGTSYAYYVDLFDSLYGLDINFDYDGVPRPQRSGPDMGAYELTSTVVGRHAFYNNSTFDGDDPGANASDDGAIATNKTSLLPGGTATFANYTSYSRGINGVMVDIANLPSTPTVADFAFKVGNDSNPAGWATALAASSITVRAGAGAGGSDRITILWADNAIAKQWLQVTVLATANTGLLSADIFYFGNAIGETGNSPADAEVSPADEIAVRNNSHTLGINPADVTDAYDFNRDRKVGPTDAVICRNNGTSGPTALNLISVP